MAQETAVQWLVNQLVEKEFVYLDDKPNHMIPLTEIIEQAKLMEKEQIEDAFQEGKWDWNDHLTKGEISKDLAQYYNETYGKK